MYSFPITRHVGFGEVLRGHRRAARLTLEQLADVSGVSARTLSDMERGRSKGLSLLWQTRLPWKGMPASSLSS
jgi:transcriptional regulator with XRE-family HTH domain